MTCSKGLLNFKKQVLLGQRLKIKGFMSRVGFSQVKKSVLRIQRIKGWHPHLYGLAPIHIFKVFWYIQNLLTYTKSYNDISLNFLLKISMLFTWYGRLLILIFLLKLYCFRASLLNESVWPLTAHIDESIEFPNSTI